MHLLNLKVIIWYVSLMTLCPFVINWSFLLKNVSAKISAFLNFHEKVHKFGKFWPSVPKQCFFEWFQCFSHSKIWSLWIHPKPKKEFKNPWLKFSQGLRRSWPVRQAEYLRLRRRQDLSQVSRYHKTKDYWYKLL